MSKEKFIYNTHTLQYERIEVSGKEKALKYFGIISAFIVSFMICFPILQKVMPKDNAIAKKEMEIEQMKLRYDALQKQQAVNEKAITALQQRDAKLFRLAFNADPIDPSLYSGGTGGSDKFANLANFASSKTIVETQDKVERMSRLIALQSRSFDTIARLVKEKEKMLSSIPSIKPVRADLLAAHLDALSGFGWRIHPIHKVRRFHKGIDFTADQGTAIQATGEGTVVKADYDSGGYGKCVIISHGYGYQTLYGHMSQIDVKEGDKVKKGQRIGLIGSTGQSTGPHCHYEVHLNGEVVNPVQYCLDGLSPSEYAALVAAATRESNSKD
jgi:murein DD-endopeptidase MepM/ murein hydrolase activator NlpD